MAIYAKKYNKSLKKWEIVSPTSDNDVVVLNNNYTESGTPVTLNQTLSHISGDIEKLQRNVSWLAEHGGGGGGYGTGSTSNYGITITSGGLSGDQLYVRSKNFSVSFKITGGTATDYVQYRCSYDGNALDSNYTKIRVNSTVKIDISDIEKYSRQTPHTFTIDAIDPDGMSIPSAKLNVVETSIILAVKKDNNFEIGSASTINVEVTNKILNSDVIINVKNTTNGYTAETSFHSNTTEIQKFPFDFFGKLVDSSTVSVGSRYNLTINAQVTTSNGLRVDAEEISASVLILGSTKIVINLSGLPTKEDFENTKPEERKTLTSNGNLTFGFTPFLKSNASSVYYAIRLSNGSTSKDVAGYFDLVKKNGEKVKFNDNPFTPIGSLKSVTTDLGTSFEGDEVLAEIRCWSADGTIDATVSGACRVIAGETKEYRTQVPIRGSKSSAGNTMYASWGNSEFTNVSGSDAKYVNSSVANYLPVNSTDDSTITSNVTMTIHGTNGEVNGFMSESGSTSFLRLSNEAYATVEISEGTNGINTWKSNDGFTISVTFKSDFHPYNDRTIFFMGTNGKSNEFISGLKIDLEKVYWYFTANGTQQLMEVNIQQNTLTTVDFVYVHKTSVDEDGNEVKTGMAKIYVNGIINAAKEANDYQTYMPNIIYLGSNVSNDGGTIWNNADVNIYDLRIFSKYLNDIEVVVNSHNDRAKRDENGAIDAIEYDNWKKKNFLQDPDKGSTAAKSLLYGLVDGSYTYLENVGYTDLANKEKTSIPVVYLNGQNSGFAKKTFVNTNLTTDQANEKYGSFTLNYFDPNVGVNGKEVVTNGISVSIQGTSTTTLRSKNLELYFTNPNGDGNPEMFQPKDTWFPESEFTLKADVVDSAHANNATLGKWINTYGANTVLEPNPAMIAASESGNTPEDIDEAGGKHGRQAKPTVKHTLEGFPVILLMQFSGETSPTFLGIYSFNLGRYSYYNMGFKFLKSFSRRKKDANGKYDVDEATPALVDTYKPYARTDTITYNNGQNKINLSEVYSFEFGSDADDNDSDHATWSQDDLSIIEHLGEFKYNGGADDPSSQPASKSAPWLKLQELFAQTARISPTSKVCSYDGKNFIIQDEQPYSPTKEVTTFTKKLSIKNAYGYFVIAMAFGMVDSLGKNLTLRTWGDGKWYPAFYDMDTALGLTNSGEESVPPTAYIDSFENSEITDGPNTMIVTRNALQTHGYGAYNSKLWNILRATSDEQGHPSTWASYCGDADWSEGFYGEFWRKLRDEANGPLSSSNKFISLFTDQTSNVGEMVYNDDFTVKYLTKYLTHGDSGTFTYGNIEMLHGTRTEYIRSWLKDRFYFLDGVLNVSTAVNDSYPYYVRGYITCGGVSKGNPVFTISTTSPTIFTAEVGQNGQVNKWFIPAYTDTKIILPPLSSDSKRVGINSTTIITKLEGLKDNRFEKFESMLLPSLSEIDLNLVETLSDKNPVDFSSTFITRINGKNVSDVRKINLSNTKKSKTTNFPVTLSGQTSSGDFNYWKLNSIDISHSCVTSLILPSSPLSKLDVSDSKISSLTIESQPYLSDEDFNFRGCDRLQTLNITKCRGLKTLDVSSMNVLNELNISNCDEIQSIVATGNTQLTNLLIQSCTNLTSLNLDGCNNENLQITIYSCDKLEKIILSNLKTKKPIIMPTTDNLKNVKTLSLSNTSGIDGFKFGEGSSVLQYKGENVLDLSQFTALPPSGLTMQNASSVKYVKFANDENNPFSLRTSFFNGCTSLKRVFGNIELKGQSIFNGCGNYTIHGKNSDGPSADTEVSDVVTQFVESNESNSGFVTNIQIGTNNLSDMFRGTSCSLYDLYYILLKCDNVTDISRMFMYVRTIETNAGSNSLKAEAFSHCGKVTNMDGLFFACGFTTRLPSPTLDSTGKVTSNGIFQYMPNLTVFTGTFNGNTVYADDKVFYKTSDGNNLKIKNISWFNPIFVKDANSTEIENAALAEAGKLFRYMPDLNSIDHSFNGASIYFSHVDTGLIVDNTKIYSTDIFYNTTGLTTVAHSFLNLTACGYIRNIFGGYKTTRNKSDHFPSKITTVVDSFSVSTIGGIDANNVVFDDGEKNIANIYIGDSFLANISSSIQYLGTSDGSSSNSLFYGKFTKYVDTVDLDGDDAGNVNFPCKVLLNCRNLKGAPGFFSGMKRPENVTGEPLTLPYYTENGEEISMFKDAVSLTNFAYGFSNLQIPFKLKGFGFANATNLTNVTGLFQNSNLQDQVPYGLFYREVTKKYTSMTGLTYAAASDKHIDSGNYGVENLLVSGGQVKVNLDKDGKLLTSKSEPFTSGGTIYYMDDYGELCIATIGSDGETTTWTDSNNVVHSGSTDDIKNPVDSSDKAISSFSGSYKTCINNITRMDSIFSGIKSTGLTAYTLSLNATDLTIQNYNSGSDICRSVIEDNPNYNPIFVTINKSFDPRYWIHNSIDGTRTKNDYYDPRRVIGNSAYDNYPKIWNKWINDGTSTLYTAIIKSDIYDKIGKDGDIGISSGLPDDISSTSVNSVTTLPLDEESFPNVVTSDSDKNDIKVRQQTRNYFVAGDLFRYCANYATIYGAFKDSGGDKYDTPDTGWPICIRKGFYGSIPPFLFENVKNTTSLANMFSGVKGLTPYSWIQKDTKNTLGYMFPPYLLNGMDLLNDISNMFQGCYIYPYEQIPNTFFITNSKLKNLSYLFYDCKFGDTDTTHDQLPSSLFINCSDIQNVKYMFCREQGWSSRAPHTMSKDLFTYEKNPAITNVTYFMYRGDEVAGSVPEFWNQFKISYYTKAYTDVGTNAKYKITNYTDIKNEWK